MKSDNSIKIKYLKNEIESGNARQPPFYWLMYLYSVYEYELRFLMKHLQWHPNVIFLQQQHTQSHTKTNNTST